MISIKNSILNYFIILSLLGYSVLSPAMIVFDPNNFAQNIKIASETFQMEKDARQSLENLKYMYSRMSELRDINLKDLQQLSNLGELIESLQNTVDDSYGTVSSELATLDPSQSRYNEDRDSVLAKYYEKPIDPNEVQASFQGEMDHDQLEVMKLEAKRGQQNYKAIQQAADAGANEQRKANSRRKIINKHANTIKNLGDKSELKTQQVIASEVNLQLQQNEQLIQQQNESLMDSKLKKADQASEKIKENKYEEARLKNAVTQGTSGLGRDKWGDM